MGAVVRYAPGAQPSESAMRPPVHHGVIVTTGAVQIAGATGKPSPEHAVTQKPVTAIPKRQIKTPR